MPIPSGTNGGGCSGRVRGHQESILMVGRKSER